MNPVMISQPMAKSLETRDVGEVDFMDAVRVLLPTAELLQKAGTYRNTATHGGR